MSIKFKKHGNVKIRVIDDEIEEVFMSSDYLDECIYYINSYKVKSIDVTMPYYQDSNINFLEKCPHVTDIALDSSNLKDISGLLHINKIKSLSITESVTVDGKVNVDLSLYPNTETLYIHWTKKVKGLSFLHNLKELAIWKYAPATSDLSEIASLCSLEILRITQGKIASLNGIESLQELKHLELNYLRNLSSLKGLETLYKNLKTLETECCKKIEDFSYVKFLTSLEVLKLCNSGQIESLSFIKALKNLTHFVFSRTNLLDGDITPCLHLNYVYYDSKKHYSHNWSKIDKWTKQVKSNII